MAKAASRLSTPRLHRFAARAMENAYFLHDDSIHLYRRGSFGSALALSVLAAEEIGKFVIVENVAFQAILNAPFSDDEKVQWLGAAFDHLAKQAKFLEARGMGHAPLIAIIKSRTLERDKQQGMYVGLPRAGKKGRLDLDSRLSTPRQVGRVRVERQITSVSDCLISLCLARSCDAYGYDVEELREWMTLPLARRLNRTWPRMGIEALRYARREAPEWAKRRVRPSGKREPGR